MFKICPKKHHFKPYFQKNFRGTPRDWLGPSGEIGMYIKAINHIYINGFFCQNIRTLDMNNDDCRGLQFRMMRKCLKIVLLFSCIRYRQTMQMTCITCSNISSNMFKIALRKHHFKRYFQKNFRGSVAPRTPHGHR